MTFSEVETRLIQLGASKKYGLSRMRRLLEALGNPQNNIGRIVHVAGTNGKGSTCWGIALGALAQGHKVGLHTSPHLNDIRERCRVNMQLISEAEFAEAGRRVLNTIQFIEAPISYFEALVALSFLIFAEANVDISVIEVGLGGRLDATNVVKPDLCVITPIGLDHQDKLGETLTAIAKEKAGIFKPEIPVISAHQVDEVKASLESHAAIVPTKNIFFFKEPTHPNFMLLNATLSLEALSQLNISEGKSINELTWLIKLLEKRPWPGRLHLLSEKPFHLLDGAHNPHAGRALAKALSQSAFTSLSTINLMVSGTKGHNLIKTIRPVIDLIRQKKISFKLFYATLDQIPHAQTANELKEALQGAEFVPGETIQVSTDPAQTFFEHRQSNWLVFGSTYLVGAILHAVNQNDANMRNIES